MEKRVPRGSDNQMRAHNGVINPDKYYERIKRLNIDHYAGEVPYYMHASLREVEKVLLKKLRPGSRLLDLGCGAGRFSVGAAMYGFDVLGVDITPEAIFAAENKAKGLKAKFIVGDMTSLKLENEKFDYVFCPRFSINAIATRQQRKKAVSGMIRVADRSGLVFIESFNKHYLRKGYFLKNTIRDFLIRVRIFVCWVTGREYTGLLPGDITYKTNKVDIAPDGYAHLPTVSELRRLIPEGVHYRLYSIPQIVGAKKFDIFKYFRYSIWIVIGISKEALLLFDNKT